MTRVDHTKLNMHKRLAQQGEEYTGGGLKHPKRVKGGLPKSKKLMRKIASEVIGQVKVRRFPSGARSRWDRP